MFVFHYKKEKKKKSLSYQKHSKFPIDQFVIHDPKV